MLKYALMKSIKIVEATPVLRSPFSKKLTFFSLENELRDAQVVFIKLRNKSVAGVINWVHLLDDKSNVKKLSFQIKKLGGQIGKIYLGSGLMGLAAELGRKLIVTESELLSLVLPANVEKIAENLNHKVSFSSHRSETRPDEILNIEGSFDNRCAYYINLVRNKLSKKSLLIVVPNPTHGAKVAQQISKLENGKVIRLDDSLPAKELYKNINNLWAEGTKNYVVIATPTYALFGTNNVGAIVIEKESGNYRQIRSPYVDTRVYIATLANTLGVKLYCGDDYLSLEAQTKTKGIIRGLEQARPLPQRSLVDLKPLKTNQGTGLNLLTPEFKTLIDKAISEKTSILAISARRGLASVTVCADCGQNLNCSKCRMPLVLHEANANRFFLCHHCYSKRADLTCPNCGSWKLTSLGTGIEGLASQIRKEYRELPLELMSSDTSTRLSGISKFVLVTEALLPQIKAKFDNVVVAYIDSLLALPEFRVRERVFRRITEARNLAISNFLVQTRRIDDPIFSQAIKGDSATFTELEQKSRKQFGYPPAMHIIKISIDGSSLRAKALKEEVLLKLKKWNPLSVPPNYVIIRQPIMGWPNPELLEVLLPLRTQTRVELDPESII